MVPQPVMKVVVKKTRLDEGSSSGAKSGVKCLLHEARQKTQYDPENELLLKTEVSKIDSNMGFAQMSESLTTSQELVSTKFGKTPVGSFLSYQTSFTESNFVATASLTAVPRNNVNVTTGPVHYLTFPLYIATDMVMARQLDDVQRTLLYYVTVDEDKVNSIESNTRDQAVPEQYLEEGAHLQIHSVKFPSHFQTAKKS